MNFELLMERYMYSGVDPLEDWSTEDLAELEILINSELQERAREGRNHGVTQYRIGCDCPYCRRQRH